jgi:hypothetical protein
MEGAVSVHDYGWVNVRGGLGAIAVTLVIASCASCGLDFGGFEDGPDAGRPAPPSDAASGAPDAGDPHVLAEDGGHGWGKDAGDPADAPAATGRRAIPDDVLARHAIAYSGYRTGQSPDTATYPTAAQIREDLTLLARGGWTFLRLFDSGTHAERVLDVIKTDHLDMKVALGIWISGTKA